MNPSSSLPSPGWPKPLGHPTRPDWLSDAGPHDFLVLNTCPELTPELPARLPLPTGSGPLQLLRSSRR